MRSLVGKRWESNWIWPQAMSNKERAQWELDLKYLVLFVIGEGMVQQI